MNKYFIYHDFYNKRNTKNFHIIPHFKTISQKTDYTCGPICVKMILDYYGIETPSETDLIKIFKSVPVYGTSLENMISGTKKLCKNKIFSTYEALKKNKLPFETFKNFKSFVLESIKNKIPIIVENIDYGGHYKIIIGYDEVKIGNPQDDILIFADPSDFNDGKQDGYNYFPAERFYYTWFDRHCLENKSKIQAFMQILKENS